MNSIQLSNYSYINLDVVPWSQDISTPVIVFSMGSEPDPLPYSSGGAGEIILRDRLTTDGSPKIELVASLGSRESITPETIRRVGGILARWLANHHISSSTVDADQIVEMGVPGAFTALCEGMLLGAFRFDAYKHSKQTQDPVCVFLSTRSDEQALANELARIKVITSATNLARAWSHEPGNVINPETLSNWIERLCTASDLDCQILDHHDLKEIGAGGLLAVGKGSQSLPRLIIIRYPGQPAQASQKPVVLVGKTITFDSGGYSMKDIYQIQGMKYDKSGGMAVTGVIAAAALLKLEHPVTAVLPVAENMVSEQSYRPDDIVTLLSGTTVEVTTTDSEGRLVLADALTYAQQELQPRCIIDIATLTSGIITALGRVRAGVFSNNDLLAEQLLLAGERTHERLWRMPLDPDYLMNMRSEEADLKNSGGREGHPIYGGVFLNHFIRPDMPWAHLDITGVSEANKSLDYCPKGATGFGVRLLIDFFQRLHL